MIETWLPYFAITLAIELPIIAALVGRPRIVFEQYKARAVAKAEAAGEDTAPQAAREKWPWQWDVRWRLRAVGLGFLVNLTTHPIATVIWLYVLPVGLTRPEELLAFYLLEVGVVLAEGILLWIVLPISFRRALLISFVANVPSAAISPILWA